jgi:hypothetical protein
MGKSRGGLFAINLEPHHSLFKEPLVAAGRRLLSKNNFRATKIPPNAGQSIVLIRWTDPNSAKNRNHRSGRFFNSVAASGDPWLSMEIARKDGQKFRLEASAKPAFLKTAL